MFTHEVAEIFYTYYIFEKLPTPPNKSSFSQIQPFKNISCAKSVSSQ